MWRSVLSFILISELWHSISLYSVAFINMNILFGDTPTNPLISRYTFLKPLNILIVLTCSILKDIIPVTFFVFNSKIPIFIFVLFRWWDKVIDLLFPSWLIFMNLFYIWCLLLVPSLVWHVFGWVVLSNLWSIWWLIETRDIFFFLHIFIELFDWFILNFGLSVL